MNRIHSTRQSQISQTSSSSSRLTSCSMHCHSYRHTKTKLDKTFK